MKIAKSDLYKKMGKQKFYEVLQHYFRKRELETTNAFCKKLGISSAEYWSVAQTARRWQREGKKDELINLLAEVEG